MAEGPLEAAPLLDWYTTLRVDAMYFRAACEQKRTAESLQPAIESALEAVRDLQHKIDVVRSDYDALEPLAIQLEGREYDLALAYAPMLAAVGAVHVLAASAAEAHINDSAESHLPRKAWERFERIATESKWLFLPQILGCGSFDVGAEPYQGLTKLFRHRNTLVHYKPRREPWSEPGVPAFLGDLGLTLEAAEDSLNAVRHAVSALSELLGEAPPSWLSRPTDSSFFELYTGKAAARP